MNAASPDLAVRPAAPEMVALAVTVRPDWNADIVAGILRQAADKGMTWKQVLVALPKLMTDPQAMPADLLPKPQPWKQDREVTPDAEKRGAALARQLLAEKGLLS